MLLLLLLWGLARLLLARLRPMRRGRALGLPLERLLLRK